MFSPVTTPPTVWDGLSGADLHVYRVWMCVCVCGVCYQIYPSYKVHQLRYLLPLLFFHEVPFHLKLCIFILSWKTHRMQKRNGRVGVWCPRYFDHFYSKHAGTHTHTAMWRISSEISMHLRHFVKKRTSAGSFRSTNTFEIVFVLGKSTVCSHRKLVSV